MRAELLKFKIYSSKLETKWKIFKITDDLSWIHDNNEANKNYYWFTGYRDSANIEMFEGDIIKFTQHNIETIGYIEFRRDRNRNGFYIVTGGNINYVLLHELFVETSNPLIIGNIISHRHLIEKR